jgi:ParB family chromosome partitioning protein
MQIASTQKIDPNLLAFSPWNVNSVNADNQAKLEESIRRNGIYRPVIVRELEDGALQVIGGEHTTRAAIALGYSEIDVYNLGYITEKRAKEISVIDNQHYGQEDAFGLASLLKEFDGNVEDFLPMSDADLKAIFKSTSIDFDSLELPDPTDDVKTTSNPDDDLAAAPVTHTFMRYKVPLGDAEFVQRCIDSIIKRQKISGGDSLANAGDALVYLCNNQAPRE